MLIDQKWVRFAAQMSSAVFTKVLLIVGGYWLGSYLDERFDTYPFLMFLGIVGGAGLGLYWLLAVMKRFKP